MKYRELLNKAKEMGIMAYGLAVANAIDCILDFDYNEKEFEQLCDFGVDIILDNNNITAEIIAQGINELVTEEGNSVDEVLEMSKLDFIEEIAYLFD